MTQRKYRLSDRFFMALDGLLRAGHVATGAAETSPAAAVEDTLKSAPQKIEAARLMRVNHTGEVCAQALYLGQAALARTEATRALLERAAEEEQAHLQWCTARLGELDAAPSQLNRVWFSGAYLIGMAAAALGDRISLGFLRETERQVVAHLDDHLGRLPVADRKSRAILTRMRRDEATHAARAESMGASRLPAPVRGLMRLQALVMKTVASRI